jgi:c(7)-type cytochrome triheme protein
MRDRRTRQLSADRRRITALAAVILASLLVTVLISTERGRAEISVPSVGEASETPQDFSRFQHDSAQHRRLPCLVCHVRNDNSPTLRLPGHIPCSSCHKQQFDQGNASPICSICHTATDVKRFPGLRSFNAVFDHGRHARQTNCATCHRPASRGVAMSIPSRAGAHATCFQCHGPRTMSGEKNIGSCSTCHQLGSLQRTPETSVAFRRNFSHAEHARKGLRCADCHTVRTGVRRGAQVGSPTPVMHLAPGGVKSCAACHNDRRAFGDDNFSNCKRCHEGRSFRF